ncbi:MAG: alpha/beta hydrolase [Micromonosporaceae bacterium]
MVSYARLRACDPEQFRQWGAAWSRLWVDRVDHRVDAVSTARSGLGNCWEGKAYEAAARQLGGYADTLADAEAPLRTVDSLLDGLADDLRKAKGMVSDALDKAKLIPATVSEDGGSITYTGKTNLDKERKISVGRQMMRVLGDIDAAVEYATLADQTAAQKLAKLRPGYDPTSSGKGYVPKAEIPPRGAPPAKARAWWASLTPAEQQYLIHEHPDRVGWLDGVPVSARDQANRVRLAYEHERAETRRTQLTDRKRELQEEVAKYPGRYDHHAEIRKIDEELAVLDRNLKGMNAIEDRLYHQPDKPRAYLMGFAPGTVDDVDGNGKPDDDGKAVLAIGNPDTADNVATYVPGTGADLDSFGGAMDRADKMAEDASDMADDEQTAVVIWMGYDAPDEVNPHAISDDYAEDAAGDLRRFQDGLRVTHEGEPSHNTVIGHSYGTTVVGYAAKDGDIQADDLVFVASPGVGVDNADALGVGSDHVWATRAQGDDIGMAKVGWGSMPLFGSDEQMVHGRDPTADGFGGRAFDSEPGGHSDYWKEDGSKARTSIAAIVTGEYSEVSER